MTEHGCCSVQSGLAAPEHRKWRRLHGLQRPLHPQQILGWLLLILFAGSAFLLVIPSITPSLWPPLFAVLISLFIVHVVSHLTALLLDPADVELRKLKCTSTAVPEFDRSKHAHVIENGRCHLCNIKTSGPRTKHCSVCNKCVGRFDHHCKWLNHCIGGRNYVPFLVCVVSAVLACLVILVLCVAVLILYHTDQTWLAIWYYSPFNGTEYERQSVNMFALNDNVFLFITAMVGTLAAIAAGLLMHLCLFHAYISYLGITTYEYIRNYRQISTGGTGRLSSANLPSSNTSTEPIFTVHSDYNQREHDKSGPDYCSNINELAYRRKSVTNFSDSNSIRTPITPVVQTNERFCWKFLKRTQRKSIDFQNNENKFDVKTTNHNTSDVEKNGSYSQISSLKRNSSFQLDTSKFYTNGQRQLVPTNQQVIRKTCPGCRYCQMLKADPTLKEQIDAYKRKSARRKMKRRQSNGNWLSKVCSGDEVDLQVRRNQVRPSRSMPSSFSTGSVGSVGSVSTGGTTVVVKPRPERSSSLTSLPSLPPPTRRQIQSVSLKELSEVLSAVQGPRVQKRIVPHRRHLRRKSNPMSPTLSPIHESGLSNPSTPHMAPRPARQTAWVPLPDSPLTKQQH